MIVSSRASTSKLQPTHLKEMTNGDIDALLDVHLFGYSQWCFGKSQDLLWNGHYVCELCGAPNERHITEVLFEDRGHPRLVPRYSIEDILGAMKFQDRATQVVFALAVLAASGRPGRVSQASAWLRVLSMLSARLLAEAALRALGIIDEQGYVKESRGSEAAQFV